MLAPGGCSEIIDIITTKAEDYRKFLGPVKYDASLAKYLNGPLIIGVVTENIQMLKLKLNL